MNTQLGIRLRAFMALACVAHVGALAADNYASLQAPSSPSAARIADRFEPFFHEVLERQQIPGAAFVIVSRDAVIKLGTSGYSSVEQQQPILADSVFRLASVSKTFAGELTAMLASEQQLNLSDPVREYVPGFKLHFQHQPITIGNLLSQSSGIVSHAWDTMIEDGKGLQEILPLFNELRPVCEPGACYSYQNVAFSLVDTVIANSSNSTYAREMQRRIFSPLGMRQASTGYAELMHAEYLAMPHIKRNQRWVQSVVEENYYRLLPAAGANASILDVAIWLQAQLGAQPDIIKPELVRLVSSPRVRTPSTIHRKFWREHLTDAWYGLGWRIYTFKDETLVGHGGWVSGYRSEIAWSADHNIGFAVLMNAEDSSASELITTFWDWYFDNIHSGGHARHNSLSLGVQQ